MSLLQGRCWHAACSHAGELNRPWALTIYGVRWLSNNCIQAIFYLARAQISSWLLHFPSPLTPLQEGCSHHDESHPLGPTRVEITWAGLWEIKVWLGGREHTITLNRCRVCGTKSFQTLNLCTKGETGTCKVRIVEVYLIVTVILWFTESIVTARLLKKKKQNSFHKAFQRKKKALFFFTKYLHF